MMALAPVGPWYQEIILGMGSINKRQRYVVTSSLIGWSNAQNDEINVKDMIKVADTKPQNQKYFFLPKIYQPPR